MERITDPELLKQLESAAPGAPVDDPELVRQLEGIAPPIYGGDEADQRAAAMRDRRANNPAPVDPSGTGSFADKAIRVASEGASAAKESFNAGGELGVDGSTGITKAVSALADALLRGIGATVEGGSSAIGQAAREAGASQGEANRLRRDVIGLTEVGALTPSPARIAAPKPVKPSAPAIADDTQDALRAAERIGVDVPKGATGNLLPRVAGAVADAPIVGAPLQNASRRAIDQLESKATGIADELGGSTMQGAGDTVRDELTNWVKTTSKERASEIFAPVEQITKGAKGTLDRTGSVLDDLTKQAAESGLPAPRIVDELEAARTMDGGLSYQAMQRLRTEIGDRLSGEITPEPGLNKRSLKAAYGALSDDIAALVKTAGGTEGEKIWRAANDQFKTEISARRSAITKIIGNDGQASAESVAQRMLTMASDRKGADLQRLTEARKALGDDAWNELASAALSRMGQSKDGFSIARWRTDYDKLSDAGKKLLFNDDHREALDDIALVGKKFEQLQRLGNPSGTGRMGLTIGGLGLAAIEPISLLASALGTAGLAKVLSKPATAKASADWAKAYSRIAGETPSEAAYNEVKRAGLAMRSAFDRAGIEMTIVRPGVIANAPSNQMEPQQ